MRTVATFLGVLVLSTACGGGSAATPAPAANVTVTFPNLFDQGGTKVLPTYISHVITSQKYPLASITVQNTGGSDATMQVSIDLPTYGSPQSQTLSLGAGQGQTLTLSPVISYTQLFSLTTAVPAALNVGVTVGGTSLFQQSYPIEISGRDTVFWSNGSQPTTGLIATMVTPVDKAGAIATLVRDAAPLIPGGMVLGYQLGSWPATAYALGPGQWQNESFVLLQGESPTVVIDSVVLTTGGAPDTSFSVFIIDDANYQAWSAGSTTATACAVNNAPSAGATLTCTTPPTGTYHIVYYNPSTNTLSRTVTRHRPMTEWEVTYYQTQAIFQQLRAQGMVYVNLPGTGFFSSSQNVKYPSESLALLSANCIEGSLVFASAWEAMGMEPLLAVDFTHGHAFTAVRCWSGSTSCVIPVETTMVGGTATFADAVNTASTNWAGWASTLQTLDIKAARALGLTPAPM